MPNDDPLAIIESEPPRFSEAAARDILERHYGIAGSLQPLVSERDQNFRVRADDGAGYVLKIANAKEDPKATEFQIQALLHLEAVGAAAQLNTPRIIRTCEDETHVVGICANEPHLVRLVSYVAGVPLGERVPDARLACSMGKYLAELGRALRDFHCEASEQRLLWDMQHATDLRRLDGFIEDEQLRELVAQTLDEFEQHALQRFATLRAQVIHADFNPDNVLMDAASGAEVAGVIDFGDMVRAPLVVDVAIGASYLRPETGNPLALIAEFLLGYSRITPLDAAEIAILFTLIKTRIAASISIAGWRASARGAGDPYLEKNRPAEDRTAQFLVRLAEIPRENAAQVLRQVCASATAVAG